MLLGELVKKFPTQQNNQSTNGNVKKEEKTDGGGADTNDIKVNGNNDGSGGLISAENIKTEKSEMKPPPEKKMKFGN